ncbi:MAG: hypothetical protein OFPII_42260 [Osedax symbiont Rs1]|nr:MAG: hypothetical protein OFPII_42260 [Osedax symbiont Rs1]
MLSTGNVRLDLSAKLAYFLRQIDILLNSAGYLHLFALLVAH